MPNKSPDLHAKLRQLQQHYVAALPHKIDALEQNWEKINEHPSNAQLYQDLIRGFHTLAGSAGSYGFGTITTLCREIEHTLKPAKPPFSAELKREIEQKLATMKRLAKTKPAYEDKGQPKPQTSDNQQKQTGRRQIYLHDDDSLQTEIMTSQLKHYDYDITTFNSFSHLEELLQQSCPHAVVFDIALPKDNELEALAQLQVCDNNKIPTIVISQHGDTEQRLRAVRAGADAFVTKPVDHHFFIDTLDALTNKNSQDPYRILIVDDSDSAASYYAHHLQQAGMQTIMVANPLEIMSYILEFNPELILMDLYMPTCHGTELAAVIRQQENYIGTPIVFLSSETDLNQQMSAMQFGGDDFLTKPIAAHHLVTAVRTRACRYRTLRSYMARDSLTGLYNHTNIKDLLQQELARADRTRSPLCYIMLDIDHFKSVNDNYGHATGDHVIKTLARLLVKRLRKVDFVGRYGGEEFAVILPDTEPISGWRVIDELRETFEKLPFIHESGVFKITFSAGIAAYPQFNNFNDLMGRADEALYQAKQNGRNCIILAE
jgi:diguanylate cyclase (GGDEF)-like protein